MEATASKEGLRVARKIQLDKNTAVFLEKEKENKIKYRGIEFGTAGIHQPFQEIIDTAPSLFDEKTFAYIDAGETVSKNYFSFIYKLENNFSGVDDITIANDAVEIKMKANQT